MAADDPWKDERGARPAASGERSVLEIRFTDLHWLEDMDETTDLCAHGSAFVRIGGDVVCGDLDTAVGAAALNLLRTLQDEHIGAGGQDCLLPHCGHSMFAERGGDSVVILNCDNGADWTVRHGDDGTIIHESGRGRKVRVGRDNYRELVFALADQVEAFYRASAPKALPNDRADREGYEAFWREWRRRRQGQDAITSRSRHRWGGLFRKISGKKGETGP